VAKTVITFSIKENLPLVLGILSDWVSFVSAPLLKS
jgi:hypothetical protein